MNIGASSALVAYTWLTAHGLVGYAPGSALEPWYFLPEKDIFDTRDRWPHRSERLLVFARRQDNDILACFRIDDGQERITGIVVINGWTDDGYDVLDTYPTMWEWLKSVMDDIAEVAERGGD